MDPDRRFRPRDVDPAKWDSLRPDMSEAKRADGKIQVTVDEEIPRDMPRGKGGVA